MAALTGRKGRPGGKKGNGIDRFNEAGFAALCAPYHRGERREEDAAVVAAAARLEEARARLVDAELAVVCEGEGRSWSWTLQGSVDLPEAGEVTAWPVSLPPEQARPLELPLAWPLPVSHLTPGSGRRHAQAASAAEHGAEWATPIENRSTRG